MSTTAAHDTDRHDTTDPGHHGSNGPQQPDASSSGLRHYLRFGAMIVTSTVVMFVLTYTNTNALDHVRWSEERVYMAILMGAAMAVVMLGFMWSMMYRDVRMNLAIIVGAVVVGRPGC